MSDPVVIESYHPEWPLLFLETGRRIRNSLGETAVRIDHIGSTSVPGLDAKPVIDIQVSVVQLKPLNSIVMALEAAGYRYRADNPDLTKAYFRESPGERRTHIHVRRTGSWSEQTALMFRDYLRRHPDDAAAYAQEKRRLAEQYRDNRQAYVEAKDPIIWSILHKAALWSQTVGWMPETSDL
ncbi:GrpB family protein [Paenibacillus allorhizosphaerae]|uniref:Dephospho-CoA kinase n=1 Tax=Paenibacillus allorhizosphaerae TaxID=2849866 RepID=A0ABN7TIH5_9BACL|nr:GrpB family protein [Paenibacillus allorhizosphaerae]CAG7632316.1 Dephospho-CoA kinase [Paenibacillus allorhizosphaerae]